MRVVPPITVLLTVLIASGSPDARNVSAAGGSTPTPCSNVYTQAEHARYARAVFDRPDLTRRSMKRVERMRRCQGSPKASVNAKRLTRRLRTRYRDRKVMLSLTPYPGPNGTHWAIPWPIVACESGGSWRAYNPSGATGPYQLLGKGVSLSDPPIVHHRVAADLWDGGAGASHWVCKG
jgi:hypothetical protein